ncbi:MAG: urease accessory protein UreE [Alteromonadaceae bacterium]|nr:urease accessory protein UreE [Alteromonadaceae bacterium]|tara:strand:- start:597 stop:1136 length:540 start_codon:yes stop_codon:yes gene_type:complete
MLQLTERLEHWQNKDAHEPIDELCLPFELRKRGRLRAKTQSGREVGLFLNRGQVLVTGDLLRAASGELIRVVSAPETVVTALAGDPLQFAKVCYHLGNRHVPLQIGPQWLRLQPDHVLEALIERFGLKLVREEAPFEPENGAYGGQGHSGQHSHSHSHAGAHSHSHEPDSGTDHAGHSH